MGDCVQILSGYTDENDTYEAAVLVVGGKALPPVFPDRDDADAFVRWCDEQKHWKRDFPEGSYLDSLVETWERIREEWTAIDEWCRCEFCGEKPVARTLEKPVDGVMYINVYCNQCAAGNIDGYGTTLEAALSDWRAEQEKADERAEAWASRNDPERVQFDRDAYEEARWRERRAERINK